MRHVLVILFSVLLLAGCFPRSQQAAPQLDIPVGDYRLGVGDVITIRIYGGEEDLNYRVRVNDRGKLTLPFGDFNALDKTPQELENDILAEVKGTYLTKPRVWVNIDDYRPYFVQGQVARPGQYAVPALRHRGAGDHDRRRIQGTRGQRQDLPAAQNAKTDKPVRVDPKTPVRPGDTIIVEESFF